MSPLLARLALCVAPLALLAACVHDTPDTHTDTATTDTSVDSQTDTDTHGDSQSDTDTQADSQADSAVDSGADSAPRDSGSDTAVDTAPPDSATDTSSADSGTGPDSGADTGTPPDTAVDTAPPDSATDSASASADSGPPPDSGTDTGAPPDSTVDTTTADTGTAVAAAPAIAVTSPSSEDRVEATAALTTFGGTAGATAATVTWATSGGDSGTATLDGAGGWSADVTLDEGVQTVTFTASDVDGNASALNVLVAWQPDVTFGAAPPLSASLVTPATAVTGSLTFATTATLSAEDLVLDCFGNGTPTETTAAMSSSGDTWTGTVTAPASTDDCVVYARLTTDSGSTLTSPTAFLRVREAMTDARADELTTAMSTVADGMIAAATWDDAVVAGKAALAARTDIQDVAENARGLFWTTTDGYAFGIAAPVADGTYGSSDADLLPWHLQTYRPGELIKDTPADPLIDWGNALACLGPANVDTFGYDKDKSSKVTDDVAKMQYGLIHILAHGTVLPEALYPARMTTTPGIYYAAYWWPTGADSGPFAVEIASNVTAAELKAALASSSGPDEVMLGSIGSGELSDGIYATPQFFDDQIPASALTNAVVILTSCEGAKNTSLSTVFFHKGASAFLGYSETVFQSYTDPFEKALLNKWLPSFSSDSADLPLEGLQKAANDAFDAVDDLDDDAYVIALDPTAKDDKTPAFPILWWHGSTDIVATCCGGFSGDLTAKATTAGTVAGGYLGWSMAGVGDLDGDGFMDVAVGAPYTDAGAGYIISGKKIAENTDATPALADLTIGEMDGEASGDEYGDVVRGSGDLTGDGNGDAIFAAPYDDAGGTDAGAVYVVATDGLGGLTTAASIEGNASEELGFTLAGAPLVWRDDPDKDIVAGDVNGDGHADLLVGTPYADATTQHGEAYVFFGPLSGTYDTSAADVTFAGTLGNGHAAYDAAIVGDLDGDGIAEVGIRGNKTTYVHGTVDLYQGPLSGSYSLDASAWVQLSGSATSEPLKPAGAGDVDGDGYGDVVVGSDVLGVAYIVNGSTAMADTSLASAASGTYTGGSYAGWAVASAGDTDCDGRDDVIVGAPYASSNAGEACILLGPASGALACDATITGSANSILGVGIAGAGDVDGRGCEDVVTGAPYGSSYVGEVAFFLAE